MKGTAPAPLRALALAAALLLVSAPAVIWQCSRQPAPSAKPGPDLADWDLPRLVEHLRARGVPVRAISTSKGWPIRNSAFLLTKDKDWVELMRLAKAPEHIDRWRGTLYCERVQHPGHREDQVAMWGDCCLVVGPFLFFGDRELLASVRAALAAQARN